MDAIKHLSSLQNPLVKKVVLLKAKSRERLKSGQFVLEGRRELQLAVKGGYKIAILFFNSSILGLHDVMASCAALSEQPQYIEVSDKIYQKLAYRGTTEGVLAIAHSKPHTLDTLIFKNKSPLLLVAEAPEKPGNIGALLRTADAAHLDGVIIANGTGDLYNPNIIRSSVGGLFTNTIVLARTADIIRFLNEKRLAIFCASLTASKPYTEIDFRGPCAIVMGTESTGLTQEWIQNSTQNIVIPMQGEIDSMNVSVSAAILIFEAKRQRGFG